MLADPGLTERQKQSLLDVYRSFLAMGVLTEGTTVVPAGTTPTEGASSDG